LDGRWRGAHLQPFSAAISHSFPALPAHAHPFPTFIAEEASLQLEQALASSAYIQGKPDFSRPGQATTYTKAGDAVRASHLATPATSQERARLVAAARLRVQQRTDRMQKAANKATEALSKPVKVPEILGGMKVPLTNPAAPAQGQAPPQTAKGMAPAGPLSPYATPVPGGRAGAGAPARPAVALKPKASGPAPAAPTGPPGGAAHSLSPPAAPRAPMREVNAAHNTQQSAPFGKGPADSAAVAALHQATEDVAAVAAETRAQARAVQEMIERHSHATEEQLAAMSAAAGDVILAAARSAKAATVGVPPTPSSSSASSSASPPGAGDLVMPVTLRRPRAPRGARQGAGQGEIVLPVVVASQAKREARRQRALARLAAEEEEAARRRREAEAEAEAGGSEKVTTG
jgi:hypothetical protein